MTVLEQCGGHWKIRGARSQSDRPTGYARPESRSIGWWFMAMSVVSSPIWHDSRRRILSWSDPAD